LFGQQLPEEEEVATKSDDDLHACHQVQFQQQQQQQGLAHVQKVVDCIDTVRYLATDDSNRLALVDLGVLELLLSKLHAGPDAVPEVAVASLQALAAVAKYDGIKRQLWDLSDSSVLLQLLSSRLASPVVYAAHQAVAQLAWSTADNGAYGTSSSSNSIFFDSTSSRVSGCSSDSVCSGPNELLVPGLVSALADCLHPAADVQVLLSALKLLNRAAADWQTELPSTPKSARSTVSRSSQTLEAQQRHLQTGWRQVVFSVMPLLIPTHRRHGHLVLSAALELLVVLTEQNTQLHNLVVAAGCLAPLLALLLNGSAGQSLQAACILTGLVETPAAQHHLSQEPALAALLRVLPDSGRGPDVRLGAVHVLRQLAENVPGCVQLLKVHCAVPAVVALLKEVHDSDVRRAAAELLEMLGAHVVIKRHSRGSIDADRTTRFPVTTPAPAKWLVHPCAG
jgi:hypothetical protein